MELLTYKNTGYKYTYTYYLDEDGEVVFHGEYKRVYPSGQSWEHSFHYHGKLHGECKVWHHTGVILQHVFYINDEPRPYVEMNEQEKLLFQIQHPGFRFIED